MRRTLQNRRRAPRVPLRIACDIARQGRLWSLETEDVGPGGCSVSSGGVRLLGETLKVVLRSSSVPEHLSVGARVAWATPSHSGLEFVRLLRATGDAQQWFKRLAAAEPRLNAVMKRTPSEIDLDAPVYLRPPPRILDLEPEEAKLVTGCSPGTRVAALLTQTGLWPSADRLVFGLFEKGILTLSAAEAGDASAWSAALRDAGYAAPAAPPTEPLVLPGAAAQPRRYDPLRAARTMPELLRGQSGGARSPQAEALFQSARAAEAVGNVTAAIPLLRAALKATDHDREIAERLLRLTFHRD